MCIYNMYVLCKLKIFIKLFLKVNKDCENEDFLAIPISFSMYVFHEVEQMFIIDWLGYYFVAVLLCIGNIFYMEIDS